MYACVEDEMQWQVHALEDMQRSLEEDYAFRISCLVAEQEREQRLHSQVSIGISRYIHGFLSQTFMIRHMFTRHPYKLQLRSTSTFSWTAASCTLVFKMHHCVYCHCTCLSLIQELEERVWRLRGQGGLSPVAGEDRCELRAAGERYPTLSPMCPLSPGERSPRHPVPVIGMSAVALRWKHISYFSSMSNLSSLCV